MRINPLFFLTDDSLLFCKVHPMEWRNLKQISDNYEKTSGQKLNEEKNTSLFSLAETSK